MWCAVLAPSRIRMSCSALQDSVLDSAHAECASSSCKLVSTCPLPSCAPALQPLLDPKKSAARQTHLHRQSCAVSTLSAPTLKHLIQTTPAAPLGSTPFLALDVRHLGKMRSWTHLHSARQTIWQGMLRSTWFPKRLGQCLGVLDLSEYAASCHTLGVACIITCFAALL
jgi:hypothetical protein